MSTKPDKPLVPEQSDSGDSEHAIKREPVKGDPTGAKKQQLNDPTETAGRKGSTAVAWLALAVSVVHLIFSTPVIYSIYFHPEVLVTGGSPVFGNKIVTFDVKNIGRSTSENIEVGLLISPGSVVSLMPDLAAKILEEDAGELRKVRITIPYLHAGDKTIILVRVSDADEAGNQQQLGLGGLVVPSISYARSQTGPVEVHAVRFGS